MPRIAKILKRFHYSLGHHRLHLLVTYLLKIARRFPWLLISCAIPPHFALLWTNKLGFNLKSGWKAYFLDYPPWLLASLSTSLYLIANMSSIIRKSPLSYESNMEEQTDMNISTRSKTGRRVAFFLFNFGIALLLLLFRDQKFPFVQVWFFNAMCFLIYVCVNLHFYRIGL